LIPWYWSWLLTLVTVIGLWLVGSRIRWGWLVQLGANVLWVIYAITTKQYGFIIGAIVTGVALVRNYALWNRR
jgi:hypothetical protein